MKKIGVYWGILILLVVSIIPIFIYASGLGFAGIDILINFPIDGATYSTTTLDLNWTINITTPHWCAYSLNGSENNTSICPSNSYTSGANFYSSVANDVSIGTEAWNNPSSDPTVTVGGTAFQAIENSIKIVKGGSISGDEKSTSATIPTSTQFVTYGGVADLWGLTWTPSDINSATFGVVFSGKGTGGGAVTSNYIKFTDFGFSVPTSAVIKGITVEIQQNQVFFPPAVLDLGSTNVAKITVSYNTINTTNITLTGLSENFYNITIFANDTNGNIGQSDFTFFTISFPPTSSNFQNNASTVTKINGVVNWSIDIADETGLSGYLFAHNNTGTLTNGSFTTLTGTTDFADELITITKSQGNNICGQFWFNDTSNNINQTDLSCFTVQNSIPTQGTPTIKSSLGTNLTSETLRCFNISTSDEDSELVTNSYKWFEDTVIIGGETSSTLDSSNTAKGNDYLCEIAITDGIDSGVSKNSTSLTILNSPPNTPTLILPSDLSSSEQMYMLLTYNSTDADDDTITFFVYNSTDDINFDLLFNGTGFGNSSYNWTPLLDNTYYWKVKAGDGFGNSSNSSSFSFTISTDSPAINLDYPSNNQWITTRNISVFNFTSTDGGGLGTCNLWTNTTGIWHNNQTTTSAVSGTRFSFNQTDNLTDESHYKWNVNCSDSSGNYGFSPNNFTFQIDTLKPNLTIIQPTGTFSTKVDITLEHTVTDFNISQCIYNVTFKATGTQVIANKIITCNQNENFTVDTFSDYTLTMKATDSAGNVKIESNNFTVQESAPPQPPPTGGGGGAPPAIEQCETTEDCEVFGDKFVCIQTFCIFQEFEDVCNRDGFCDVSRGENPVNCGDKFVNNTLILEGDCTFADLPKLALSSQFILYTVIGLMIILAIVFNQLAKKPEQRFKAFRIPKKFFRQFK